ncbi:MAG: InlB B-repeat-containing protein [Lacrimispora sp.]|uniref:InlB B-repeat-containing protein n=1 Tax=Lacrimispora sp. TaxID=2719234 RepID=UPI0039E6FD39
MKIIKRNMKKVKRIISSLLAVVIVATSIGYAPPAAGAWETYPTVMSEEYAATPSEAVRPDEKATPSEAEPPEEKSTPSEAEKEFVREEPDEIPEYYKRASVSGRKFWKFEDRYGNEHYRDFGYTNGEAEFPLWYEADKDGIVKEEFISINLDDEYYDLAPYIWESQDPSYENWEELELQYQIDIKNKEKLQFTNWDLSEYDIWLVSGNQIEYEEYSEEMEFEDEDDLKEPIKVEYYMFYGKAKNELNSELGWKDSGKDGNIRLPLFMSIMPMALGDNLNFNFHYRIPGVAANAYPSKKETVKEGSIYTFTAVSDSATHYKDPKTNETYFPNRSNFLGWMEQIVGQTNNYNPTQSTGGLMIHSIAGVNSPSMPIYAPGYKKDIGDDHENSYYAIWRPYEYRTIISTAIKVDRSSISNGTKSLGGTYDPKDQKPYQYALTYKSPGGSIDLYSYRQWYENKEGHVLSGWTIQYHDGTEESVPIDYKIENPGTTSMSGGLSNENVYFISPEYTKLWNKVKFLDWNNSIISDQEIEDGNKAVIPPNPERYGYEFIGWDKEVSENTEFYNSETFTAQYKKFDDAIYVYRTYYGRFEGNDLSEFKYLRLNYENIDEAVEQANGFLESLEQSMTNTESKKIFGFRLGEYAGSSISPLTNDNMTFPISLYPIWKKPFTVRFRNYDYFTLANVVVGQYDNANLVAPEVPKRDGYIFTGWLPSISSITADITTMAQYVKLWNLTIDAGNGGGTINDESTYTIPIRADASIWGQANSAEIKNSLRRPGYRFTSYYTDPEFKTALNSSVKPTSDITLYPQFVQNYTTTYIYWNVPGDPITGDSAGNVSLGHLLIFGDNTSIANISKIEKKGRRMVGFAENRDGSGRVFTVDDIIPENVPTSLYCIWEKETSVLTLDGNGGLFVGNATKDQLFEPGESIDQVLLDGAAEVSRTYYTFAGWYTAPVGGSKYPEAGNTMPDSNLTIYAQWTRSSSLVTYKDWNGDTLKTQVVAIGADATPPEAPDRLGYTFTGWSQPSENIEDHTVITAHYTINSYKLTLDGNGGLLEGETSKEHILSYGTSFDQALTDGKDLIIRQYHSFDGWYTALVGGSKYPMVGNTMPDSNVTVYARWTRTSSLVTFWDADGNIIKTQEVRIGESATPPEAPIKKGYTFIGWDKNSTGIQDHTTITARYEVNSYSLTLDGNGGLIDGKSSEVRNISYESSFDQALADGADSASRQYHTFAGWYTAPLGGSEYPETGNTMPDSSLTVYAHWIRSSSLVTYKDADGNIIITQEVRNGESATPPEAPEKKGYTFIGWDTNSTGIQDHTIITARYEVNSYSLTLDGNGGLIDGKSSDAKNISYESSFDQVLTDGADSASRQYHTFVGWFTEPIGGSQYPETGNIMPDANLTIYAHWMRSSSLVTYKNWNGGVLKTQEVAIGADAEPPTDPSRPGFTFTGWDQSSANIQNHTVITAQYSVNGYKLTLDGNGGTLEGEASKEHGFSYGESFDQALTDGKNSAARTYYTFAGWYTAPIGGSQYPETGNTMPDTNMTLYAHWTRTSSLVTYKGWNGNILKTQEVAIGADATPPADPARPGYTFTGWDQSSTNIQDHLVITAQYSKNNYKLTLYGNGGTLEGELSKEHEISYGESFDQILTNGKNGAARTYYTFAGWYTLPIGGSPYSETGNTMPDSNVTVYAHWTHNSSLVTYQDWNGNVLKTQVVAIGADATPPVNPIRSGYTFTGWDQPSINIQTHTVITAQYSINGYKLTLDGNGGTLEGHTSMEQGFSFGESFDQALADGKNSAARTYYTFAGWFTAPIGGSQYPETGNTMSNSDLTLYAQWMRSSSLVTYQDWNGNVLKTQVVAIGADAVAPTAPARSGYTFTGWDKPSDNIHDHTVISAQYSKNGYTLTLNGNGGMIGENPIANQAVAYGESFDQVLTDGAEKASRKFYTFGGWYTASIGGSKYSDSGNTMPNSNVTVYAHWGRSSSQVIYQDWAGREVDKQEIVIGGNATPPAAPTRPGYTFIGWDKPSSNIQDHTVISAQYLINTYKLILDGNGGTMEGEEVKEFTISYRDSIDQILADGKNAISYPGYILVGWYTAQAGGNQYLETGNTMPANDVTIYARWETPEEPTEPTKPKSTEPNPKPLDDSGEDNEKETIKTSPVSPPIDSKAKPEVPDSGGTFVVNPDNPYDVSYNKPDGTPARDEWIGDGEDWYHVNPDGKLNYDWYLEGERTWYKLNKEPGDKFGAALIGWNYEPMDKKRYFFDPSTTKMLTGWQYIDNKWYFFTPENKRQTYYGGNDQGWEVDPDVLDSPLGVLDRPYGALFQGEKTPDGYLVDENGAWIQ